MAKLTNGNVAPPLALPTGLLEGAVVVVGGAEVIAVEGEGEVEGEVEGEAEVEVIAGEVEMVEAVAFPAVLMAVPVVVIAPVIIGPEQAEDATTNAPTAKSTRSFQNPTMGLESNDWREK
jgi:hypothetical protein